jgi:dolichol-phosphate mannosyltransferase
MSLNTFVIIPTYNESENIQTLVKEVLSLPVQVGVVVVDDNSPDGTGQLAEEMAVEYPGRVHVIHREGKLGLGTAYAAGIRLALDELSAEKIMTMDADFSHLPGYIPAMIGMSHDRHIVIGSRYVPGGGTVKWPFWRKMLSWGANTFSRTMLGLQAHDTTAGFRLYHRQVVEQVPPESIRSSGYSFLVEMLFNCEKQGFLVGEVPILFEDRQRGVSKVSSNEIVRAIGTVFRLFPKRFARAAPVPAVPIVDDGPQQKSPSQNE